MGVCPSRFVRMTLWVVRNDLSRRSTLKTKILLYYYGLAGKDVTLPPPRTAERERER
jgi:hypothetical protein